MSDNKEKKKLLIVSDTFLPRWDGVSRFLSSILPAASNEFNITLIAPDYKGTTPEFGSVKIIRIPIVGFKLGDYQSPRFANRLLRKEIKKSDLIFVQTQGVLGRSAISLSKKLGKRVAAYSHSVEWELFPRGVSRSELATTAIKSLIKRYVKWNYNNCTLLIVPSAGLKKVFEEIGVKTRIEVVNLGIDTNLFKPPKDKNKAKEAIGIEPDRIVIGYVGRIGKEKDMPTLHKAFIEVRKDFMQTGLIIVGEGNKKEEERLHGESVMRLGRMDNVIPYLQAMDIYVLASLTETSSLSTMEAMSCGLPVVTTPVGSLKYYIKEKKNGYHFKQGDYNELAMKLKKLVRSQRIRTRVGNAARKTILENFRWKDTERNIIKLLRDESEDVQFKDEIM